MDLSLVDRRKSASIDSMHIMLEGSDPVILHEIAVMLARIHKICIVLLSSHHTQLSIMHF